MIAAIDQTVAEFGGIDICVNNAGMTADNLLLRMKPEDWDRVVGTNLKGTILCTKAVSRFMVRAAGRSTPASRRSAIAWQGRRGARRAVGLGRH